MQLRKDGGGGVVKPRGEFLRNARLVRCEVVVCRVVEPKSPGVEHESSWLGDLARDVGVDRVAEEWGADVFHVNADLVSATGVEDAEDEGGAVVFDRKGVVVRDGGAAGAGIHDRHFLSRDWVATEVGEDGVLFFRRWRLQGGEVELARFAFRELCDE